MSRGILNSIVSIIVTAGVNDNVDLFIAECFRVHCPHQVRTNKICLRQNYTFVKLKVKTQNIY